MTYNSEGICPGCFHYNEQQESCGHSDIAYQCLGGILGEAVEHCEGFEPVVEE